MLSAEEEGRLAFEGVVHRAALPLPEVMSVVDVGGGSTEVAVGTPLLGPAWVRSVDLGSLRLTQLCLEGDPPRESTVRQAQEAAHRAFDGLAPPRPDAAYATGGSARAVARIVGRELSVDDLDAMVRVAMGSPAAKLAKTFRLHAAPGTDDPRRGGAPARGGTGPRPASRRRLRRDARGRGNRASPQ